MVEASVPGQAAVAQGIQSSSSIGAPPSANGPELVIGLICAVGTNTAHVCEVVKGALQRVNYSVEIIHLIETLREFDQWRDMPNTPVDKRYDALMDAGNAFRQQMQCSNALALLAVAHIRRIRGGDVSCISPSRQRTAYVLRSLKNAEEVQTLRKIYGKNFVAIGTHTSEALRLQRLTNDIANSRAMAHAEGSDADARRILKRDEEELQHQFGQNMRAAYPLADFFVRGTDQALRTEVERIIDLFFGNFQHTAKKDEYGMFAAYGASLRSASLARQVGAAICTATGEVIALGCNDVPHSGGGLPFADTSPDHRDHVLGYDSNNRMKRNFVNDLLYRLQKKGWLDEAHSKVSVDLLVEEAVADDDSPLRHALLMDIIDYGRAVHAEMDAITDCARRGVSLQGCTLYTTTFPCHNCAKHILAAGISRLVYIEPYTKSYTRDLYGNDIIVDSITSSSQTGTPFESFIGIAPRMYARMYFMGNSSRKQESGEVLVWEPSHSVPRDLELEQTYMYHESEHITSLTARMKAIGLEFPTRSCP